MAKNPMLSMRSLKTVSPSKRQFNRLLKSLQMPNQQLKANVLNEAILECASFMISPTNPKTTGW